MWQYEPGWVFVRVSDNDNDNENTVKIKINSIHVFFTDGFNMSVMITPQKQLKNCLEFPN